MTRTPWGNSNLLRERRLRPGPGAPRDVVAANQRERLFGAIVAVVAERGYDATTVADLVRVSGVSRSSFYEHFAGKRECFLAAVDAAVEIAMRAVSEAYRCEAPWDQRLRSAFEAFVDVIVEQPAAAHMCFVDLYAAGPEAVERGERAAAGFERLIRQSFEQSPDYAGVPPKVVRGIVGGIRKVIHSRLRRGEAHELPRLVPELWRWAASYRAPGAPIRRPRARAVPATSPRFVAHDQVERIFEGLAASVVEKGYGAVAVADIAARASTSLSTFYAHFRGKEDAFLAAYDSGTEQAFAAAHPAYQRAPDWPHAVRAGLRGFLAFLAAEPAWAHVGVVEVLAAGPRALERRDGAIELFASLLQPGLERRPGATSVAPEAIGGAVYALVYDHITRRGAPFLLELVPILTFIALAPFIGPEAARTVANEGGHASWMRTQRDASASS